MQVKRAQGHLLEFLYNYVTNLNGVEAENLLDEDPGIMQKRAAAKQVSEPRLSSLTKIHMYMALHPHVSLPCCRWISSQSGSVLCQCP